MNGPHTRGHTHPDVSCMRTFIAPRIHAHVIQTTMYSGHGTTHPVVVCLYCFKGVFPIGLASRQVFATRSVGDYTGSKHYLRSRAAGRAHRSIPCRGGRASAVRMARASAPRPSHPIAGFYPTGLPAHTHCVVWARDPHCTALTAKGQEQPNVSILLFQPRRCMICFLKNNTMMKAAENEQVSVSWSSKVGIVVTGTLGTTPCPLYLHSCLAPHRPSCGGSAPPGPFCALTPGAPRLPPAWAAPHPKAWDNSEPCVQR